MCALQVSSNQPRIHILKVQCAVLSVLFGPSYDDGFHSRYISW